MVILRFLPHQIFKKLTGMEKEYNYMGHVMRKPVFGGVWPNPNQPAQQ